MILENRPLSALVFIWCGIAITGLGMLARYSAGAGAVAAAINWPANTSLPRPTDRFLLLVFVHPGCPCSQATLEEVNRLTTQCDARMATTIVFVKPTGSDLQDEPLWKQASRILHVKLIDDVGGSEAARFGAATSGQLFLFDPSGHSQFRGGITASRGHFGDNDGEDCIAEIVAGKVPPSRLTPVYGCRLFNSSLLKGKGQSCKR